MSMIYNSFIKDGSLIPQLLDGSCKTRVSISFCAGISTEVRSDGIMGFKYTDRKFQKINTQNAFWDTVSVNEG